MITTSESIKAISAALLQFQGMVDGVKKDGKNPHFKSRYATLENVVDTARPALQEIGILFTQAPGSVVDGSLEVTTRLTHPESGEWMESTMHMPLGKRDPQGAGSATTYALRYSLMAMLGLPPTDDDGESAMDRSPQSLGAAAAPKKKQAGWREDGTRTPYSLHQDGVWQEFERELLEAASVPALTKLAMAWSQKAEKDKWPESWKDEAREEINKRKQMLLNAPDDFPGDIEGHPVMAG